MPYNRVDKYVTKLIQEHAPQFGLPTSSVKYMTRKPRMRLALNLYDLGMEWESIEVIIGKRLDRSDKRYQGLLEEYKQNPIKLFVQLRMGEEEPSAATIDATAGENGMFGYNCGCGGVILYYTDGSVRCNDCGELHATWKKTNNL